MLNKIKIYENFIIVGLLIVASIVFYFYIDDYKSEISRLKTELKDTQIELANTKLESERFKNVVHDQNKNIETLKASEKLQLAKLKKIQSQKPSVRYKIIEKIREVKSDECKDIQNVLDSVKRINPQLLQ